MNINRRRLLASAAGTAAVALVGHSRLSLAAMEDVEQAIGEFAGDATLEEGGPLSLTTPEIAENGNSVPISFSVDSPMTDDDYVESVVILASENPSAEVATFNFTPRSGEAKASTRMRLAKTQDVIAVARTSSGNVYRVGNNVKVTIGGCGG